MYSLLPKEQIPLHWPDHLKPKLLRISLEVPHWERRLKNFLELSEELRDISRIVSCIENSIRAQGEWNWSGAFPLEEIASFPLKIRKLNDLSSHSSLRVHTRLDGVTILVIFAPDNPDLPMYRIENQSRFTFIVQQEVERSFASYYLLLSFFFFSSDILLITPTYRLNRLTPS